MRTHVIACILAFTALQSCFVSGCNSHDRASGTDKPLIPATSTSNANRLVSDREQVRDRERFIQSLLDRMTLEEKVGQLVQIPGAWEEDGSLKPEIREMLRKGQVGAFIGVDGAAKTRAVQSIALEESRLGIPVLFGLDVIHGYRTVFPVPLAATCSWDPVLIEAAERIAAVEGSAAGLHWTFAPMVDIARDPRWGRVVEGAGEDPYLGSVMAAARVRGFQTDDLRRHDALLACAKHFVAYGGAEGGRDYNTVDVTDRTLREIYLPPFQAAAEAGAGSFMSAFNDIGGVPASAHHPLLTGTLRRTWKWDGFVVSDWESVKELQAHGIASTPAEASRAALSAGVDMDMSSRCYHESVARLVRDGLLDRQVVEESARRVLRAKHRLGLFDDPHLRSNEERELRSILTPEHRGAARDAAGKSIVLLKNASNRLPLNLANGNIAVIGALADDAKSMLGPWSISGKAEDAVTILAGVRAAIGEAANDRVNYAPGYDSNDFSKGDIDEAVRVASSADVILLALGEPESMSAEAKSRASIELPVNQLALFDALHATGKPIVVLLVNGRPMAIPTVHARADAVVETWFLGVEMGNAVADVLFGKVNPGGKLAVTFPASTGQIPLYYNHRNTGRPEDPKNMWTTKYIDFTTEPLYHFGHGLSYTQFAYSDLSVSPTVSAGGTVEVSFRIKNVGDRAGDEVVQLYINDPVASIAQPVKSLKGFRRITLQPSELKSVRFELPADLLAFLDANMRRTLEPGDILVMLGSSSDDIRLDGRFKVVGRAAAVNPPATLFTEAFVE